MCETLRQARNGTASGRRNFLRMVGVTTTLGLAGGIFFRELARADALTKAQRDKMTPEQIIGVMKEGNERFRRGERKDRNYLREQRASAKGQYPAAILLRHRHQPHDRYSTASDDDFLAGAGTLNESREVPFGSMNGYRFHHRHD